MNRAGGWILGLLAVGGMLGGGWFALRPILRREPVNVYFTHDGKDPTRGALIRGAQAALRESGNRAGRFGISLVEMPTGDVEFYLFGPPGNTFAVSAFDTRPPSPGRVVTPRLRRQGEAAAAWARKTHRSRVVLLRDKDSLQSQSIAAGFESEARRLGLQVDGPLEAAETPADRIVEGRPDLVFYSGEESPYTATFKVFSALRAKGFDGPLATGEADPEVSFLATRPDLVEGTYLVSPFAPAPPEVAARMGITPGPHVTAGYYAMKSILDAIDLANSKEPGELRRAATRLPYFDTQGGAALRRCALYVARGGLYEFVELLD